VGVVAHFSIGVCQYKEEMMMLRKEVVVASLLLFLVIFGVWVCYPAPRGEAEATTTVAPVAPIVTTMPTEAPVAPESEGTSVSSEVDRKLEALGFAPSANVHKISVKN